MRVYLKTQTCASLSHPHCTYMCAPQSLSGMTNMAAATVFGATARISRFPTVVPRSTEIETIGCMCLKKNSLEKSSCWLKRVHTPNWKDEPFTRARPTPLLTVTSLAFPPRTEMGGTNEHDKRHLAPVSSLAKPQQHQWQVFCFFSWKLTLDDRSDN